MSQDDATKASEFLLDARKFVDKTREKYGIDWCDRHTAMLISSTPVDVSDTELNGVAGFAACIIGSNVMMEHMMGSVAQRIGIAYEDAFKLPEGVGSIVALDKIRHAMGSMKEAGTFGPPGSKGKKGYQIHDDE